MIMLKRTYKCCCMKINATVICKRDKLGAANMYAKRFVEINPHTSYRKKDNKIQILRGATYHVVEVERIYLLREYLKKQLIAFNNNKVMPLTVLIALSLYWIQKVSICVFICYLLAIYYNLKWYYEIIKGEKK